jgi:hypothetical protein
MNKIILIGNGFDLAHGLKTSYKDFIDDYWEQKVNPFQAAYSERKLNDYSRGSNHSYEYKDNDISINGIQYYSNIRFDSVSRKYGYENFIYSLSTVDERLIKNLHHNNQFLEQITNSKSTQNWVDIETEYYLSLTECLNDKRMGGVKKLNEDFSVIQRALGVYLLNQTIKDINRSSNIFINLKNIIDSTVIDKTESNSIYGNILFLNFNYTNTERQYIDHFSSFYKNEIECIHIHGELNKLDNPIIFGYGDEIDDNYKLIEKKNDNRYLENVKSIKYLETDNYRKLLSFIIADKYQIFIIGHSCGISDRTLLNTLFEHENCKSIQIYYHKREDGSDNYSDVTKNISRNFTNKALMREKVVNKKDSEPLIGF